MLIQTKRAVDALLKAGLRRRDFRVRTTADKNGEYRGDPFIVIMLTDTDLETHIPAIVEAGLTVKKDIYRSGVNYHVRVTPYGEEPGLIEDDRTRW